ncbi:hypothetical protein STSO111631_00905 [Stackebrandtia soli]
MDTAFAVADPSETRDCTARDFVAGAHLGAGDVNVRAGETAPTPSSSRTSAEDALGSPHA